MEHVSYSRVEIRLHAIPGRSRRRVVSQRVRRGWPRKSHERVFHLALGREGNFERGDDIRCGGRCLSRELACYDGGLCKSRILPLLHATRDTETNCSAHLSVPGSENVSPLACQRASKQRGAGPASRNFLRSRNERGRDQMKRNAMQSKAR